MSLSDVQTATENLSASLAALSSAKDAKVGAQVAFDNAQSALASATDSEVAAFQDAGRKLGQLIAAAAAAGVTPSEEPAPVQALKLPKLPPIGDVLSAIGQARQVISQLQTLLGAIQGAFPQKD